MSQSIKYAHNINSSLQQSKKKNFKAILFARNVAIEKNDMSDERYISNISANEICQGTAKLFVADILRN